MDDVGHDPGHVEAGSNGAKPSVPQAAPLAETPEAKLPRFSTRGATPGPRGCWATNKQGEPCGAARRADSDYCNTHSGFGVAEDPAKWSKVASAKSAEVRRRRATLRLALGPTRLQTPRGLLKAAVFAEAEAVVAAALDGATDPAVPPAQRAKHALDLIREAEPSVQASVSLTLPDNPEGVEALTLSQLLSFAEQEGIALPSPATNGLLEP